jgi:hypothetical protein
VGWIALRPPPRHGTSVIPYLRLSTLCSLPDRSPWPAGSLVRPRMTASSDLESRRVPVSGRAPSARLKPSSNGPILQVADFKRFGSAKRGSTAYSPASSVPYKLLKPQRRIRRIRRNLRPFIQNLCTKHVQARPSQKSFHMLLEPPPPSDRCTSSMRVCQFPMNTKFRIPQTNSLAHPTSS